MADYWAAGPAPKTMMVKKTASGAGAGLARAQLWLVRLSAFAIPLLVVWTMNDQVVLAKLLAARAVVVLLAALLVIRWARGDVSVRRTPLDLPILAYVASAAVSTLFAANSSLALFGEYGRWEGLLTIATYAALFWLSAQSVADQAEARSVFRALLAGAFLVSLIAIWQVVTGTLGMVPGGPSATAFDGTARATATFGNANVLAAYLAMALPLAIQELVHAGSPTDRLLSFNVAAVVTVALVLTFGRGGWLGAAAGVAIVLALDRQSLRRVAVAVAAVGGVIVAVASVVGLTASSRAPMVQSVSARLLSLLDPTAGSGATRLHIWKDTLAMIASRPITGFGPDNFGLVYPQFETGRWAGSQLIDEAHSELLQIGATQGVVGIAIFAWLCYAVLRMCWAGRATPGAAGVLGACAGYLMTSLFNFSAAPAALPFWLFLATAAVLFQPDPQQPATDRSRVRLRGSLAAIGLVLLGAVSIPAIVLAYWADADTHDAVSAFAAGDTGRAHTLMIEARAAQPELSVYAAVAGNIEMARGDWAAARADYVEAIRLGSPDPAVQQKLAIANQRLSSP